MVERGAAGDQLRLGPRGWESAMAITRSRGVLADGGTIPFAFGISLGECRGQPTISHRGSWASFITFVVHFPSQHAGW
jgi:hypothetical protein